MSAVCFVSIDVGMGSDLMNIRVLKRLKELLPDGLCRLENLSISGTHTHSAPAGFLQYALYQVTSLGFSEEVMEAYVEGVVQALVQAHAHLQPTTILVAEDLLWGANINRSPSSYLLNPAEEREKYAQEGDTDKRMLQLNFVSANGTAVGLLNWFAVHGTSMNSTNQLISGDNKGFASYLVEKSFNGRNTFPGKGSFVAAFASTNLGDVSPNIAGPRCIGTGRPCHFATSTCDGKAQLCVAFGPGKDMFESTEIIGRRQYDRAMKLFRNAKVKLEGRIDSRHSFVDMSSLNVTLENGNVVRTCPAALGYGFAGGTTDGPGDFSFSQGTNTSNPFWNMIGGFLSTPTTKEADCQFPKPILLNTGGATLPYAWDPVCCRVVSRLFGPLGCTLVYSLVPARFFKQDTIPISIFQIGQLYILNVPSEFTTMAGRRLRKAVREVLVSHGINEPIITIAGLANSYTHYVTTFEEYAGQRYEAASTLYGPHTLDAYLQEFRRIVLDLVLDRPSVTGASPSDLGKEQLSLIPPVGFDLVGLAGTFGSVSIHAKESYVRGQDTVVVSFRSSNPRNQVRNGRSFLSVDMLDDDGGWVTKYVDADWCTKFIWKGGNGYWGTSFAEIHWVIPKDEPHGLYRICHYGTRRTILGYVKTATFHAPGWLTSNIFGSFAAGLVFDVVQFAAYLDERARKIIGLSSSQLKPFQGCTNSFLVYGH